MLRGACQKPGTVVAALLLTGTVLPGAAERNAAQREAHRPNFHFSLPGAVLSGERPELSVRLYNLRSVSFSAHRVDLRTVLDVARLPDWSERAKALMALPLARASASWRVSAKKVYRDDWEYATGKLPSLSPGAYLIVARGAGIEQRAWTVVTRNALSLRRSLDEVLAFVVDCKTGEPCGGVPLKVLSRREQLAAGSTGSDGVWRGAIPAAPEVWVYGNTARGPVWARVEVPDRGAPFTVYTTTDRPLYRPGHTVKWKTVIRRRERMKYEVPKELKGHWEIRDPEGSLLLREPFTASEHGSAAGEFQLAAEPPLGDYKLVIDLNPPNHREPTRADRFRGGALPERPDYELRFDTSFGVEAYRKPEFEVKLSTPKHYFLGGDEDVRVTLDASYYFGQPVAHAQVQYKVNFSGGETSYEGSATTDAKGRFEHVVKTKRLPRRRDVTVTATVTDLSRREVSASTSVSIVPAEFDLSIDTDRYVYSPGQTATVTVRARDYEWEPVAGVAVQVKLVETKKDRKRRVYKETTTREATTDASGLARVEFRLERPGRYALEAEAFDSRRNRVVETDSLWVSGGKASGYDYPDLCLEPYWVECQPGNTAKVLLNTSLVGATALVTLEGEYLYGHFVKRLTSNSTLLAVPVHAKHAPGVTLRVEVIRGDEEFEDECVLDVPATDRLLELGIATDEDEYRPGDTVTYSLSTRDANAAPVSAELGFALVDESLFALRGEWLGELERTFHSQQKQRCEGASSFDQDAQGAATVHEVTRVVMAPVPVPCMAPPPSPRMAEPFGESIPVRRQFLDTAYWNPSILTDADGTAQVHVKLPDNLTTWRATARAVSDATQVGETKIQTLVTQPFLVRLSLPRFYVEDDEGVVSTLVHNYTGEERTVKVRLKAEGAEVSGEAQQTLTLADDASTRVNFRAKIASLSESKFTLVADAGEGAQDALELKLPTHRAGATQLVSAAGVVEDEGQVSLTLPETAVPGTATLTVTLTPSLAAAVFEALEYLTHFPYGCAEQTLDSFLPDVAVTRALKKLGVDWRLSDELDLPEWVSLCLQKLYRYQHEDGGWNWWEFDETDPWMTAYVVDGLMRAQEAGILVDDDRIRRGAGRLWEYLTKEREDNLRAYLLHPLSRYRDGWGDAQRKRFDGWLREAVSRHQRLETLSLAQLVVTLRRVEWPDELGRATATLEARVVRAGNSAHWPAETRDRSWRDNDAEVTAAALRALLTVKPDSDLVLPTIRWLMAARQGVSWRSTKDTAAAVFALTLYLEQAQELRPEFTAEVRRGEDLVKEIAFAPADVFASPKTITLTDLSPGEQTLTLAKDGAGKLYYTASLEYAVTREASSAQSKGIGVKRVYLLPAEDPSQASETPSGREVTVSVELTCDANCRYVLLEEPIPAGCEVAEETPDPAYDRGGRRVTTFLAQPVVVSPPPPPVAPPLPYAGSRPWRPYPQLYDRRDVWDDKVLFFFNELSPGTHRFTYRLRTETPGRYHIRPATAYLMYFPEVRGNTGVAMMRVGERTEDVPAEHASAAGVG